MNRCARYVKPVVFSLFAACALGCSTYGSAQSRSAESPRAEPPQRNLWSRGETRFLKQWLMLGPIAGELSQSSLQQAGGEGAVAPEPNQTQASSAGERRWVQQTSFASEINVAAALNAPSYRGHDAPPEVAFAYKIIKRETAGDVDLSIGSDGPFRIWVNGAEQTVSRADPDPAAIALFSFDAVRVPVHFSAGENRVLLKLAHRSGPWLFALRVLEKGTPLGRLNEIAPSFTVQSPSQLAVKTDTAEDKGAAPVRVVALAAGGKTVAQADAGRGDVVKWDSSAWPEGPYEFQLTTRDRFGDRVTTYLPWFKGDALAAAKRTLESAKRPEATPHERMLADMIRDRLGGSIESAPDDIWRAIHSPLMELQELAQSDKAAVAVIRPSGFARLAFTDPIDGSTQFCRVFLPPDYSADRKWPFVIFLHGYYGENPPYINWWSVDARHNAIAEKLNVIYAEPHGRGNAQYLGIGEPDVLRCLNEAKRRLSVDEDRVYLTGESMGGAGTWLIASHHPQLFAAAAPVYGGWDYRLNPAFGSGNPAATRRGEQFSLDAQSSFTGVEGLLNVPLLVTHGDSDSVVSPDFSRHVVRMMQRWSYDIRYREIPGRGHEDLDAREQIAAWLLTHRRNNAPREVRVRAATLGDATAHWVQVRAWDRPLEIMRVDAEVTAPGIVRLDTENVASVALSPPRELLGSGPTLHVVWNGAERTVPIDAQGVAWVSAAMATRGPSKNSALTKKPALAGGLSNFFTTPYVVVVGTASRQAEVRKACREKGEAFAKMWETWQHVAPRMLDDSEVTPEIERSYSMLLIGGAEANLVSRRFAGRIPLQAKSDSVVVGGRKFAAKDAVAQTIYPSPTQPDRYVLLIDSTSPAGMQRWNVSGYVHSTYGFPTAAMDWLIDDGHRIDPDTGFGDERGWVASGVFDMNWRRDDRWTFLGDEALRIAQ